MSKQALRNLKLFETLKTTTFSFYRLSWFAKSFLVSLSMLFRLWNFDYYRIFHKLNRFAKTFNFFQASYENLEYFKLFLGRNRLAKSFSLTKQGFKAIKLWIVSSYFIDRIGSQFFFFAWRLIFLKWIGKRKFLDKNLGK